MQGVQPTREDGAQPDNSSLTSRKIGLKLELITTTQCCGSIGVAHFIRIRFRVLSLKANTSKRRVERSLKAHKSEELRISRGSAQMKHWSIGHCRLTIHGKSCNIEKIVSELRPEANDLRMLTSKHRVFK
jgi:hypothetical protein